MTVGILLFAAAGCDAPGDTEHAAYLPVGLPERTAAAADVDDGGRQAISVTADLAIEVGLHNENYSDPFSIAVADDGSVYALDGIEGHLRVFDADGGELETPDEAEAIARAVGFRIVASGAVPVILSFDPAPVMYRLSRVGGDIAEFPLEEHLFDLQAMNGGGFVGLQFAGNDIVLLTGEGQVIDYLAVLPSLPSGRGGDPGLWPKATFSVGGERVYMTPAADYEVAAFSTTGTPAWVLRVPWEREEIPDHVSGRSLGRVRRAGRASAATLEEDMVWPERYPALAAIQADHVGRLYVFPYTAHRTDLDSYPVDIYSPDGELLANATLPFQGWHATLGDAVYRVQPEDGRLMIVRYRLDLAGIGASAADHESTAAQ